MNLLQTRANLPAHAPVAALAWLRTTALSAARERVALLTLLAGTAPRSRESPAS